MRLELVQQDQVNLEKISAAAAAGPVQGEDVLIKGDQQEKIKDVYKVKGHAVLFYKDTILHADYGTYDRATGEVIATGHVIFDSTEHDEHLEASHGTYNVRTESGRFYDVTGTIGSSYRGRQLILTTSNPFAFTGKVVDRVGPDRYVVHHGTITSCELPHPKWTFNAPVAVVNVGGTAKVYNSTFRVKGVPVLYTPFADHPVRREPRKSGFLMPAFGTSTIKGTVLGDSFYWAINRSMDATIGAENYSARGWSQRAEFRAIPNANSYLDATYYGVVDRGFGPKKIDEGGEDIHVIGASHFGDYRAVGSVDYLSSFLFRLAFNRLFTTANGSEVVSTGFISRSVNGFAINAFAQRYQNFLTTTPGQVITILHVPTFEASSVERPIANSPFVWSFDSSAGGLSRSEPNFETARLVGRFDLNPEVALPLQLRGWSLRSSLGLRDTFYTQSLLPSSTLGTAIDDPINRKALETRVELRPPSVSKVFQRTAWGYKLKHVIEPQVTYDYVTGVNNFPQILRFDGRDILSNNQDLEYGFTTRLYAKNEIENEAEEEEPTEQCKPPCEQPPATEKALNLPREFITWRVAQKYFFDPTFGGAVVPGLRNVFESTDDLTGIAFVTEPRNISPIISRLRIQTAAPLDFEWDLDYDTKKGRVSASTTTMVYRIGQFGIGGTHAFLQTPGEAGGSSNPLSVPLRFDQFRLQGSYGNLNRRGLNLAASVAVDANLNTIQFSGYQASYNWDCCGVTFELRRLALGPVLSNNEYRFAFSIANIGTFGNLRRQERLF
jgi:LPS-assembly protein